MTDEGRTEMGAVNTDRKLWHDRLGAMIDQVGHPDYSLRELVDGLRVMRDEIFASAMQQQSEREMVLEGALTEFLACPCISHDIAALQTKHLSLKTATPTQEPSHRDLLPGLEHAVRLLAKNGFEKSANAVQSQIDLLLTPQPIAGTPGQTGSGAVGNMVCIFCQGTGVLHTSEATRELSKRAVESQRNDTRTVEEKIQDGVKFVMGPGGDEGTRPDGDRLVSIEVNGSVHVRAAQQWIDLARADLKFSAAADGANETRQVALARTDGKETQTDNWASLVKEYESKIGNRYRYAGVEYTFFGLVHSDDDYYYGMSRCGDHKLRLLSCVGNLESHGFDEFVSTDGKVK